MNENLIMSKDDLEKTSLKEVTMSVGLFLNEKNLMEEKITKVTLIASSQEDADSILEYCIDNSLLKVEPVREIARGIFRNWAYGEKIMLAAETSFFDKAIKKVISKNQLYLFQLYDENVKYKYLAIDRFGVLDIENNRVLIQDENKKN
jgi:hypothetical protein